MADIINSIYKMKYLDELAFKNSPIHKIHPISKITVTLFYIITIASFSKYDFIKVLPMLLYIILIFSISEIPFYPIMKRTLYVFPLLIGVGIFNPLLDKTVVTMLGDFKLTSGWISFFVLLLKGFLSVVSALLLLSTTGIDKISHGLRQLKVPKIFVLQLSLTYRYIMVLAEEAARVFTAYSLRAPGQKGIKLKVYGSLAGQLLLRTFSKAETVYSAMKLRGFAGDYIVNTKNMNLIDYLFIIFWLTFFLIARLINIPLFIGNLFI